MIVAWRIVRTEYAAAAFSGEGAAQFGGRWNLRNTSVVYLSSSLALGILESFIHIAGPPVGVAHVSLRVEIPEEIIEDLPRARIPGDWREYPPPRSTQELGTDWVKSGSSAVLRVPSVLVPEEKNYILNPAHGDFASVSISEPRPLEFDRRLWHPGRSESR